MFFFWVRHDTEVKILNKRIQKMNLDAAASQQNQENCTEKLLSKIAKIEKNVVGDATSTIDNVVEWKVRQWNRIQ